MRTRLLPFLAGLTLLTAACGMPAAGSAPQGRGDVITAEQMLQASAQTVYDAVERLRPDWLTTRGPESMTNPTPSVPSVFIGGNEVGDVRYLQRLTADDVDAIRYYEAGEASALFGRGHQRGVIEVIMKGAG